MHHSYTPIEFVLLIAYQASGLRGSNANVYATVSRSFCVDVVQYSQEIVISSFSMKHHIWNRNFECWTVWQTNDCNPNFLHFFFAPTDRRASLKFHYLTSNELPASQPQQSQDSSWSSTWNRNSECLNFVTDKCSIPLVCPETLEYKVWTHHTRVVHLPFINPACIW